MQRASHEIRADLEKALAEAAAEARAARPEMSHVDDFMEQCRCAYLVAYAQAYTRAFQKGHAEFLTKQLRLRFGELPPWVSERLQTASDTQFDRWIERVLIAGTLDAVFAE